MASSSRTLYVGVTGDIQRRVLEHRNGTGKGVFTTRYRINRLVYYEHLGPPIVAISREKQIKGYDRKKRLALVGSMNPRWDDLAESWFDFPFAAKADLVARAQEARNEKFTRKPKQP